ncbi:MAG: Fe-S cluster assembly protein IscX, partial [Verrucomicrobia bacterium]|nr:Fe-S cluster assembly protein IscX [Verrucomicrobiota bacterium]
MNLTWQDSNQIAWQLADNNPDVDPLSLSFIRLREMVLA